ncbi:ribosome recycling factor [Patescibacteria group bacterium]|nr:ribosome recycling factor [Patescibacteria group bacterium]
MPIHKDSYLEKFEKTLNHAQDGFATLRTGRASAQLLDSVFVEAYGSRMALHEVASISAPDTQLLVVKPWDKNLFPAIEKAIQQAQLNLNPIIDGDIIRIAVPSLTQERRQEMVKILSQKEEEAKVMLRSVRAEIRKDIEKQEGEAGVSEDDIKSEVIELDETVKEYITNLEEISKQKEKELLNI